MLKVSQNANTIQHLSFLPSKKSKTYHGQYEKYTSILTLRMQHSTRSVYLGWTINCSSSLRQRYFSFFDKRIHFTVNTKSKNTQTIICSSWRKRLLSFNFTFPGKTLISLLTNKNLNHSWFQKNRTKLIRLSQMFEPEQNHHQMQMLILNRLRLKNLTFLKYCLSATMMCLRQSLWAKRDTTTNWKSHQENFDSQTKLRLTKPNNNMQSLDYITQYCVYFVLLEVT